MRILVTGGAGFIGSTLVRACLDEGDEVRVLDDLSSGHESNLADVRDTIEFHKGSVTDPSAVAEAVAGSEVVYHLAAQPSVVRSLEAPLQSHAVNVSGTVNVLESCREAGVRRFVFASSCAIYGDATDLPLREALPPRPLSPYAAHKLMGEIYCHQFTMHYGLETVALRFFNVFGPRQDPASLYAAVVPLFLRAALRGESATIYGDGQQSRDFIMVDDVVAAARAAAQAPGEASGRVFNVGSGTRVSVGDLFGRIAHVTGSDRNPCYEDGRAGEVRDSQADVSLTEAILGWRPAVTLDEGLRRTAEALAEQGGA